MYDFSRAKNWVVTWRSISTSHFLGLFKNVWNPSHALTVGIDLTNDTNTFRLEYLGTWLSVSAHAPLHSKVNQQAQSSLQHMTYSEKAAIVSLQHLPVGRP